MKLAAATGGASRTLLGAWRNSFYLAFSPDSTKLAALTRPGSRQAQAGRDRHRERQPTRRRERVLQRLRLLPGRCRSRLREGRAGRLSVAERHLPRGARRRQGLPPDQRPQIAGPALGAGEDRLRQTGGGEAAQVRPEERALPDESGRQGSQAPHPTPRSTRCCSASSRPSGRRTAAACSPSSRARTRATRSRSTRRRAPSARSPRRAAARRASSASRSPTTAAPCSAPPAASNPATATTSPPSPTPAASRRCSSRTPSNPTGAAEPQGRPPVSRADRPGAGSRRCRSRRPCA